MATQIQHLLVIMEESGLSPEDLGARMGVSGMTVRRWQRKPPSEELSELYGDGARKAVFELVVSGRLKGDSRSAQWAFASHEPVSQQALLAACGFPVEAVEMGAWNSDAILNSVSKLGTSSSSQTQVMASENKILSFKSLGESWSDAIKTLLEAIKSASCSNMDKAIAFGALFYLLMPFDLIPDSIPVVGLLDDFAILTLAANHLRGVVQSQNA